MVSYTIHSVPLFTEYKTHVCSRATLAYIICTLTTIISPLLIAYRSEGFWRKIDWYIEQPDVHFKHEVIVLLETLEGNKFISWSTYETFNELMEGHILIPMIDFREEDNNRDGINDVLYFNMSFYLDSEDVHAVTLLLLFDYRLQKFCRLEMEAMAYIQEESALSGFEVGVIADLALNQRIPLPHAGKNTQYNVSVINSRSIYASDYDLRNILEAYTARNITTILNNVYSTWKTGRGTNQPFLIRVTIRYPEQLILYPF